jgi:hypothetical protein
MLQWQRDEVVDAAVAVDPAVDAAVAVDRAMVLQARWIRRPREESQWIRREGSGPGFPMKETFQKSERDGEEFVKPGRMRPGKGPRFPFLHHLRAVINRLVIGDHGGAGARVPRGSWEEMFDGWPRHPDDEVAHSFQH